MIEKYRWMTTEELHRTEGPFNRCECDNCEMNRELEDWWDWAWDKGLDEKTRNQ